MIEKKIILAFIWTMALCWIFIIYQMWKAPNDEEK